MNTNKKEIIIIVISVLIFAYVTSFSSLSLNKFIISCLFAAIILLTNIFAKKLMAWKRGYSAETNFWHMQRYGIYPQNKFKHPAPLGVILPIIFSIISLGGIKFLALTETKIEKTKARTKYRFLYEERDVWRILGCGVLANLVLTILGLYLNLPELAKYSAYFAFWNMLPISQLDGNKMLFSSKLVWLILTILSVLFLLVVM